MKRKIIEKDANFESDDENFFWIMIESTATSNGSKRKYKKK